MVGAGYGRHCRATGEVKRTFPLFFGISAVVKRVSYVRAVRFRRSVVSKAVAAWHVGRRGRWRVKEKEDVWMVGLGVVLLWAKRETWEEAFGPEQTEPAVLKGGRGRCHCWRSRSVKDGLLVAVVGIRWMDRRFDM